MQNPKFYMFDKAVPELVEFLDKLLGPEVKVYLVGHSAGSVWAQVVGAALTQQNRLLGLGLMGAMPDLNHKAMDPKILQCKMEVVGMTMGQVKDFNTTLGKTSGCKPALLRWVIRKMTKSMMMVPPEKREVRRPDTRATRRTLGLARRGARRWTRTTSAWPRYSTPIFLALTRLTRTSTTAIGVMCRGTLTTSRRFHVPSMSSRATRTGLKART